MKTIIDTQEKTTALHEAAHGVMGLLVPRIKLPYFITIVPNATEGGSIKQGDWTRPIYQGYVRDMLVGNPGWARPCRDSVCETIMVSLAGYVAEELARYPEESRDGWRWADMLWAYCDAKDFTDAFAWARAIEATEDDASTLAIRLAIKTEGLLREPALWAAVEALASHLLVSQTLEGAPLEAVVANVRQMVAPVHARLRRNLRARKRYHVGKEQARRAA